MTTLTDFLRRAHDAINTFRGNNNFFSDRDGEVVFSKNNVCVHDANQDEANNGDDVRHTPGYLTITCRSQNNGDRTERPTLVLNWLPNTTLHKNPASIRSVSPHHERNAEPHAPSPQQFLQRLSSCEDSSDDEACETIVLTRQSTSSYHEAPVSDHTDTECSSSTEDEVIPMRVHDSRRSLEQTAEKLAIMLRQSRLTNVPTASPSLFSVDLGKMRSMRLFYSNAERTSGQLVISSHEAHYKILHFHHGGMDRLAELFEQWHAFAKNGQQESDQQLRVFQPEVQSRECDPEEGLYKHVTHEFWTAYKNAAGVIHDSLTIRKAIYFASMEPGLRREIWPFLLQVYEWETTEEEREATRKELFGKYGKIRRRRQKRYSSSSRQAWDAVEQAVLKDVVRTDRKHPFYTGDHNPNIDTLTNILLNYASSHRSVGYVQGMSDLLAPILATLRVESDSYWAFAGLVRTSLFARAGHESLLEQQLKYLRELLRLLLPEFHAHLTKIHSDALQLMFVHRWILLFFKREFKMEDSLRIWEACWARYRTGFFHLFIAVAIVSIYGGDIVAQNLPHDEILLYFSSLAMHMDVDVVLKKARGLLHHVSSLRSLPCALRGLLDGQSSQWTARGAEYKCDSECEHASP